MAWRLVQCMREGLVPDLGRLRRRGVERAGAAQRGSVEKGSAPVKFPDFTRGRWREARRTL